MIKTGLLHPNTQPGEYVRGSFVDVFAHNSAASILSTSTVNLQHFWFDEPQIFSAIAFRTISGSFQNPVGNLKVKLFSDTQDGLYPEKPVFPYGDKVLYETEDLGEIAFTAAGEHQSVFPEPLELYGFVTVATKLNGGRCYAAAGTSIHNFVHPYTIDNAESSRGISLAGFPATGASIPSELSGFRPSTAITPVVWFIADNPVSV